MHAFVDHDGVRVPSRGVRFFRDVSRFRRPLPEIFAFFSNARDLECIRPPGLQVEILSDETPMGEGLLIDYAVTLRGVPFRWRSRIRDWHPPAGFVDEQVSGPFSYWSHRHTFTEESDGSVLMEDIVAYRLPAWPFGEIAAPWVHRELGRIFAHRREKIRGIFGAEAGEGSPVGSDADEPRSVFGAQT